MKHLKRMLILGFIGISGWQNSFAQFNTLGRDYPMKSVSQKKCYPPDNKSISVDSTACVVPKKEREKKKVERPLMALPLKSIFVTSPYGYRVHPVTGQYKLHNGIDLRARYEKVYSMLPGKVHKIGADKISGKYVIIATGNYLISYCHLSEIRVGKGSLVSAGDVIAISGKSGKVSGPHLHLTVKSNQKTVNPAFILELIEGRKTSVST